MDQTSDISKLKQAESLASEHGHPITKDSQRRMFFRQFRYHQLQLCQELTILKDYDLPEVAHIPDNDTTLTTFLLKQQNQTITAERPVLLDFKAPIEIELLLLKDIQT